MLFRSLVTAIYLDCRCLWLADMGLGKTLAALTLLGWMRKIGHGPALVLVPNAGNVWEWLSQRNEHCPHLQIATLDERASSAQKRQRFFETDVDFVVCTYAGLRAMIKSKEDYVQARKRFDQLYADEITYIRNKSTKTHKIVRDISSAWLIRVGMTGAPLGRKPEALWGQFYIVDRGRTLGKNLGQFRAAFFKKLDNFFGTTWVFEKRNKRKLNSLIRCGSIRYSKEECTDLPRKIQMTRRFSLTIEQQRLISKIIIEAERDPLKASASFVRCRQVGSGMMVVNNEIIRLKKNPRLDALLEYMGDVRNAKCIIFYKFIKSGEWIMDKLIEIGRRPVGLHGGQRDKQSVLQEFTKGDATDIVIQIQSGAFGLNLQCAHYVVFYEPETDPMLRRQAEDRPHRFGQKEHVIITDLIAVKTLDERIQMFQREGRDLHAAIVEGSVFLTDESIVDKL